MKQISKEEAAFIRTNHPNIHVAIVNRFKKSNRKKYYIEESEEALSVVAGLRGRWNG